MNQKLGKIYKLKAEYPNVKFVTSTVDAKAQKTFNYEVRFWLKKKEDADTRVVLDNLFKATKKTIHKKIAGYFDQDKFIAIKDIPNDLDTCGEQFFGMFEFTLFPMAKFSTPNHVTHIFSQLSDHLYEDVFEGRSDIKKGKKK
jgi:hypothetical protein